MLYDKKNVIDTQNRWTEANFVSIFKVATTRMLNTSLSLIVDFQRTLNILDTSPINRETESKNNRALSTLDQVLEQMD